MIGIGSSGAETKKMQRKNTEKLFSLWMGGRGGLLSRSLLIMKKMTLILLVQNNIDCG